MKNYQTEQSNMVAGLLVGGVTVLGTVLGSLAGFLIGGGASEFLNQGWIWTVNGLVLGSLVSAGMGLLGLAILMRNNQSVVAWLLFGWVIVFGTILGGFTGFLLGGGASEFLNGGWILKTSGLVFGSILSAGLGLIGMAIHIKNNQSDSNLISYK